jgi:PAS domain S-box-containing protein
LYTDANLYLLVICRQVNLSLEHGNCDASCFAYEWLAMVAGARFGDYRAAYSFGRLGCDLVEQRGLKRFEARTYLIFGGLIIPWTRHVKSGRDLLRRSFEAANKIGDLTYAAYGCDQLNTNMLAAGDSLVEAQREFENGLAFARKVRFGLVIDLISAELGLVRTLRGLTRKFGSFDDEQFDEREIERRFAANPDLALAECWYSIRKLQARFFAGDYPAAVEAASTAQRRLWTAVSRFETAEYHFYGALSHAASCDFAAGEQPRQHIEAVTAHYRQLEVWAANCPENFENRAALVGAEIARIDGRDIEAMRLYEKAIRSARANAFVHNEALAYELAARFYAARGFEQIARMYLREARQGYLRWGADGKARQLDESFPHLLDEQPLAGPRGTIGTPVEHLELSTVLKVSQAVSGEIVLEKLVDALLRTAVEHTGAERGLLILPRGDDFRIEAEASPDTGATRPRDAIASAEELPESVLHYAARAHESVILDDAAGAGPFTEDEYIRRQHARSILCLPLVKQARLVALLYLENNLATGVFTPAKIAVLKVLASQAAMSLENSRLYRELEQREAKIRRLVDANVVGVLVSDEDGRLIEANDAFLEMVGYTRDDLTSGRLRWPELTPPESRVASERAVAQLRATGTCDVFEKEYFRRDGSRVPVLVGAAAVDGPGSETVAFVLDLTERKRAEEERERLRQAQDDLAYLSRVATMGELAASLAHEIKQPIAAAVTNARTCALWLEREMPDLAEASEAASRTVNAAMRASDIVDRVRSLYTRGTPHRQLVDVNDMIQEMVVLLQHEASRHAVAIRTELAERLPDIIADRVQVQQVLMNLMLNGIEAMKDAPGELVITSQRTDDGQLLISVSDSGVGIPAEQTERIFEAFFTTKPRGTGMGLSVSRTIVESHGGRVWASANTTRGATFQFTLPGEVISPSPSAV